MTQPAGTLDGTTPDEVAVAEALPVPPPRGFDPDALHVWFASLPPVVRRARTDRTWHAYATDLAHVALWAEARRAEGDAAPPVPTRPEDVCAYLTDHVEQLSLSTLGRRLAALSVAHRLLGVPSPTDTERVKLTWAGLRRLHGPGRAPRRVAALETRVLVELLAPLGDSPVDHRDRALLVLGFAGALRRSELSALDAADVVVTEGALLLTVPGTAPRTVELPWGHRAATCPVRSWQRYRQEVTAPDGPAFVAAVRGGRGLRGERLGARGVAEVVKRRALEAGVDPTTVSSHSLRAGFVTTAVRNGVPSPAIARQTGHRSAAALAACVREDRPFPGSAAAHLGL